MSFIHRINSGTVGITLSLSLFTLDSLPTLPLPLQYVFDQYQDEYDDTYDSHNVGAADSETAEDLFTVKRYTHILSQIRSSFFIT